jgi:hypothetical protein
LGISTHASRAIEPEVVTSLVWLVIAGAAFRFSHHAGYSMISSARASTDGGIVRLTSSNVMGFFDQHIRRLGTLQDSVHVDSSVPKEVRKVRSISQKTTGIDQLPPWVHCRQPVLRRELHNRSTIAAANGTGDSATVAGGILPHRALHRPGRWPEGPGEPEEARCSTVA